MPKATFTKDFVWKAKRNVRIAYQAGKTYGVTTVCLAAAAAAGAVEPDTRKTATMSGRAKTELDPFNARR